MNQQYPITISVENLSDIEQEASVFSFIENNESVKIKSGISTVTYEFIRNMLYKESYVINKTYISIADHKFINTVFRNTKTGTSGSSISTPHPLLDYFDPYQQQEGVICIETPLILEAGSAYKINLLPKQKISLSFEVSLKFYGPVTNEIMLFARSLLPYNELIPIQDKIKKYELKEIHNLETRGYDEIFHPDWDSGITHIRTIGVYPERIVVGNTEIKTKYEAMSLFEISDKIKPHTPLKIEIPKDNLGYVLFYKING